MENRGFEVSSVFFILFIKNQVALEVLSKEFFSLFKTKVNVY